MNHGLFRQDPRRFDRYAVRRQSCAKNKRRTIGGPLNWSLVMRVAGRAIVEATEQGRSRNDASGRRRLSMAGGRLHPSPQVVAETSSSNKSCHSVERRRSCIALAPPDSAESLHAEAKAVIALHGVFCGVVDKFVGERFSLKIVRSCQVRVEACPKRAPRRAVPRDLVGVPQRSTSD